MKILRHITTFEKMNSTFIFQKLLYALYKDLYRNINIVVKPFVLILLMQQV